MAKWVQGYTAPLKKQIIVPDRVWGNLVALGGIGQALDGGRARAIRVGAIELFVIVIDRFALALDGCIDGLRSVSGGSEKRRR